MNIPLNALSEGYIAYEGYRFIVTLAVVMFCVITLFCFRPKP